MWVTSLNWRASPAGCRLLAGTRVSRQTPVFPMKLREFAIANSAAGDGMAVAYQMSCMSAVAHANTQALLVGQILDKRYVVLEVVGPDGGRVPLPGL